MEYTKVSNEEWEEIVLNSNSAYFFHSPLWAKIMEKTYDYRPDTRLYSINGKEILIPLMKQGKYGFNFMSSMPFDCSIPFGYGGFFSKSEITSDEIKNLIHKILGGKNIVFDFSLPPLSNLPSDFEDNSIIKFKDYWTYTHILHLNENFDHIWKNKFRRGTRKSVKKALKSGVEIRKGDSLDDFKTFYDIYSTASHKWGYETPPDPFELYKNMYKYGSNHVDLYLAQKDEEVIAGNITLNYGKYIYKWRSAFLNEFGSLRSTSLLYSYIIEDGCKNGFKYVDMGSSGNNSGVRKFKESFGPDMIKTNTFRAYSRIGRLGSNFYKIIK